MQRDHIREWLSKPGPRGLEFDGGVLDQMGLSLLDALEAAGGPDKNLERYVATLKAIAMMLGFLWYGMDRDEVHDLCRDHGELLFEQIQSFQKVMKRDNRFKDAH